MNKKQVVSCAIMLIALVISKVFIYGTPVSTANKFEHVEVIEQAIEQHNKDEFYASLSFANETLPMEEKKVERRINRVLANFSFSKLGTHKLHTLSESWFKTIEPILEKHGIPEDFKYVPLVESGVRQGVSSKGATGYWQFMPNTARRYGLTINDAIDERKDLAKSTEAACRYIKDLHRQFGSWTLAAAAYNVGEGSLMRSIKSQKQDNYYLLSLNSETSAYIYRIVSMKEIIEHPAQYGYRAPGKEMLASNSEEKEEKEVNLFTAFF
ncbi:MAG TPA: transglycosylase SLT domain-containing protein [Sphingobacteriaceae bacterium]|nr:transglycosylase SLT domain-containing protein [Sphingobacteriaceae bacterium]